MSRIAPSCRLIESSCRRRECAATGRCVSKLPCLSCFLWTLDNDAVPAMVLWEDRSAHQIYPPLTFFFIMIIMTIPSKKQNMHKPPFATVIN
jgi:hypothetical protein